MANKKDKRGIVYSTDPEFDFQAEQEEIETIPPAEQRLVIRIDTKHRKGKTVTLVDGFIGQREDMEALGKKLKTACGTGGSAKDGLIIVQGEHLDKIKQLLKGWGYGLKK